VFDADGRVLLIERDIERFGAWIHEVRLPKGKIEPGETARQAAVREVREETGYGGLEIVADLGHATHEFTTDKWGEPTHVTRHERYFAMRLADPTYHGREVDADSEEALFRVRWARHAEEAIRLMTYEGESQWVKKAAEAVGG